MANRRALVVRKQADSKKDKPQKTTPERDANGRFVKSENKK